MSAERAGSEFERLLRQALAPVEPPADLAERVEVKLSSVHSEAIEELESWELSAMRDPRNWVKPAGAAVVATGAGAALIVLRVRSRSHKRRSEATDVLDLVGRTLHDAADELTHLLPRDTKKKKK
jgi:hypothetical protein